jgi:hypothetical protein
MVDSGRLHHCGELQSILFVSDLGIMHDIGCFFSLEALRDEVCAIATR